MSHINHEHRHVFVHVPKTGGTSMEREPFVGGNSHGRAKVLIPKAPDYFSWGFVRHPCDRLFSAYTRNVSNRPCQQHPTVKGRSLRRWVTGLPGYYRGRPHTLPMTEYLCWKDGKIAVDYVGRFERLEDDWQKVCLAIGVEPTQLTHWNESTGRLAGSDWREHFTDAMIEVIADIYSADFETFGYTPNVA